MSKAKQFSQPGLPLTTPVFYILLSLSLKERHGYELYTTLKRLLGEGLIAETTDRPDAAHDDERRRYYRLTDRGGQVLATELQRLEHALALARQGSLFSGTRVVLAPSKAYEHE